MIQISDIDFSNDMKSVKVKVEDSNFQHNFIFYVGVEQDHDALFIDFRDVKTLEWSGDGEKDLMPSQEIEFEDKYRTEVVQSVYERYFEELRLREEALNDTYNEEKLSIQIGKDRADGKNEVGLKSKTERYEL